MRPCPGRAGHLAHSIVCPFCLALAIFFLFILPAFIKEPRIRPYRYQYTDNTKKRFPEPAQKIASETPTTRWDTGIHAVPEKPVPETPPRPTDAALLKRNTSDRASPGGQDPQGASVRTGAAGGSGPKERLSTARTARRGPDEAGAAKTLILQSRSKMATAAGAAAATRTRMNATSGEKEPRPTPGPGLLPNSTTPSQRLKAANFKLEPQWDFEENYTIDAQALKTTCQDSVKIRASRSPWLQHLFLPNITLFLDSRHLDQREWERLEHFAPPYGFMELNHSLVQKVVTRFPPVPQQQLLLADLPAGDPHCITCAVVGNGGILNNSHVGRDIDSHHYVFRLSGAVMKGYEEDVGTRTSFYGFTAFSLTQSLLILGGRGFQHVPLGQDVRYLHFLEGTRDYEWLEALLLNQTLERKNLFWFRRRPQTAFQEALRLDRYLLLHPDFLRYMKNRFLRSKILNTAHWRIYRPTTGALLLLTALHLCDKVSAYGFITEGYERFSDHYYDKSWKKLIFYLNHDFKLEKSVWKRLHDEGIIWLYQRPQNTTAKN